MEGIAPERPDGAGLAAFAERSEEAGEALVRGELHHVEGIGVPD